MNVLSPRSRPSAWDACRACGPDRLMLFLPMGDHVTADMRVRPADRLAPQPACPPDAQACLACGMIQVADQIPAGFFQHSLYTSPSACTMHTHVEAWRTC